MYVGLLIYVMILKYEMFLTNTSTGNIQVQMHLLKLISGDDGALWLLGLPIFEKPVLCSKFNSMIWSVHDTNQVDFSDLGYPHVVLWHAMVFAWSMCIVKVETFVAVC